MTPAPHHLPLLLALVLAQPVAAQGLDDPFDTQALTPPPVGEPCTPAPLDQPLTLLDAVDSALCASPQTRQIWASAKVQGAQVGVALGGYLPNLDASVALSRSQSNGVGRTNQTVGASLSWLLYDFGGRDAQHDSARALLDAALASQAAGVQSVLLATVDGFYKVWSLEQALTAAQQSEAAARTSFEAAQARRQAGTAARFDELTAKTAWSQAQLTRITAQGNLNNARGGLASLLGRGPTAPLTLIVAEPSPPSDAFAQEVTALLAQAKRQRPDLLAQGFQVASAQAQVESARASGLPSLSLGASAGWQRSSGLSDSRSTSLGLTLSIPLFSGFTTTYRIQAAQAQVEAARASRDQLARQVALQVWNAYQALTTAIQSLRTSLDLLASAQESERVARGRYEAGVGNILDLLNAQTASANARQQRVQALYDGYLARITLAQAVGGLDREAIIQLAPAHPPTSAPQMGAQP